MQISQKFYKNLTQILYCMNIMRKIKKIYRIILIQCFMRANIMKTRLHDIPLCNYLSDFCMILHNFMREIEIP